MGRGNKSRGGRGDALSRMVRGGSAPYRGGPVGQTGGSIGGGGGMPRGQPNQRRSMPSMDPNRVAQQSQMDRGYQDFTGNRANSPQGQSQWLQGVLSSANLMERLRDSGGQPGGPPLRPMGQRGSAPLHPGLRGRGVLPGSARAGFMYPRSRSGRRGFLEGGPVGPGRLAGLHNYGTVGAIGEGGPSGLAGGLHDYGTVESLVRDMESRTPEPSPMETTPVVDVAVPREPGAPVWRVGYGDPNPFYYAPPPNRRGLTSSGQPITAQGGQYGPGGLYYTPPPSVEYQPGTGRAVGGNWKDGGPVMLSNRRGYQAGGEVELMEGIGALMQPPMEQPNTMSQGTPPMGGPPGPDAMGNYSPGLDVMEETSLAAGLPATGSPDDAELVSVYMEARQALEGNHPNPEMAIEKYVEVFGEEALSELKAMLAGGVESDGMSDSIPANIDGQEEVALSEGEFVMPADAVSGLGNGDTASGAKRLTDMVAEVRRGRTGSPAAPEQIDVAEMMRPV